MKPVITKDSYGIDKLLTYRIVRENYLYVIGLPATLADEELLKQERLFGQYGKVLGVVINDKPKGYACGQVAVYIKYEHPLSVALAIMVRLI